MARNLKTPDCGYYTVITAAEYLDLGRKAIYRFIKSGELEATAYGRQYRISVDAMERFENRCKRATTDRLRKMRVGAFM